MQNWDHLHNSQGKWYHSVTETMGPFYIMDCGNDITVLWRMLGPFTQQPDGITMFCKLWDHLHDGKGNGITMLCKTCGSLTQWPGEMVSQSDAKLWDHLHNTQRK